MAKNSDIVSKEENPKARSDGFSLIFPKFNLQFPFFKPKPEEGFSGEDGARKSVVVDERNQSESQKPDMVRFPKAQLVVPPPEVVESEEHGKTSNPVILWQVSVFCFCFSNFFLIFFSVWLSRKWRAERRTQGNVWTTRCSIGFLLK